MKLLPLLAVALLAGCAAPAEDVSGAAAPPALADAAPLEPVVLVDIDGSGGVPPGSEFDVMCRFGGGIELERLPDARILPGVAQLAITVALPPTSTGLQVGYALDGGDVTWLPTARPGGASTFTLDVPPEAHEADAVRWSFWQQHNVFAAPQACYTGGSVAGWKVAIETVPST